MSTKSYISKMFHPKLNINPKLYIQNVLSKVKYQSKVIYPNVISKVKVKYPKCLSKVLSKGNIQS